MARPRVIASYQLMEMTISTSHYTIRESLFSQTSGNRGIQMNENAADTKRRYTK